MLDIPDTCYIPLNKTGPHGGELFESTMLSRASWYDNGQHGGAVAGLMTRAVERCPTLVPMEVSRVTIELFRLMGARSLKITAWVRSSARPC